MLAGLGGEFLDGLGDDYDPTYDNDARAHAVCFTEGGGLRANYQKNLRST